MCAYRYILSNEGKKVITLKGIDPQRDRYIYLCYILAEIYTCI